MDIREIDQEELGNLKELEFEAIFVGLGYESRATHLAGLLKDIAGFKGKFNFDRTKPDGVTRKLLDTARLRSIGWTAKVSLKTGLRDLYRWYLRYAA